MKHPLKESVGNALRRRIPMALYAFPGIDEHYCFFEAATVGTLNDEEHDFGFFMLRLSTKVRLRALSFLATIPILCP